MAWEWSHTAEGIENARAHLEGKPRRWLEVCYAEIVAKRAEEPDNDNCERPSTASRNWEDHYYAALKQARSRKNPICKDVLVDYIWEFAEEFRTCDNGGFNAYMCPDGCHKVSFGCG